MDKLTCTSRRAIAVAVLSGLLSACAVANETIVLERGTAPMHPQQPQVAVDSDGTIFVAYGVGDRVRISRSKDAGKSFSSLVDLPTKGKLSLGKRRGPRIVAYGQSICVTAIAGEKGAGRDGELIAFRSTDGGLTWSGPVTVNDVAHSAREGLHAMAVSDQGGIHCVWLDLRHGRTEVMASVSTDNGGTWSENILVYASPDGNVCECCHPSVTTHPQKGLIIQWRNSLDGARDIYLTSSTDGGKTFGKASKLGTGTWLLDACPMDGGAVTTLPGGSFASAWRRDQTVYLTVEGMPAERPLARGTQPWITATNAGLYLVWIGQPNDSVYLLSPGQDAPQFLTNGASSPVVAANIQGRGPVLAAWERRIDDGQVVECRLISQEQ